MLLRDIPPVDSLRVNVNIDIPTDRLARVAREVFNLHLYEQLTDAAARNAFALRDIQKEAQHAYRV